MQKTKLFALHPHSSVAATTFTKSKNKGSSVFQLRPLGVKDKRPHVKMRFFPHPCGLQIYGLQVETPPPYLGDYTGVHHDFSLSDYILTQSWLSFALCYKTLMPT